MKRLLTLLFCCSVLPVLSQARLENIVLEIERDESLVDVLAKVETHSPVKSFFMVEWLEPYVVSKELNGKSLKYTLDYLLGGSDISYTFQYDYALIFTKDISADLVRAAIVRDAALRKKEVRTITFGDRRRYKPGVELRINGSVIEDRSGRPLLDALVKVDGEIRAMTDSVGQYHLKVLPGEHIVSFSLSTYEDHLVVIDVYASGEVNAALQVRPVLLDEVVVTDQQAVNKRVGQTSLSMSSLKRMPSMLGAADIIKQIQNQPGVTTVGEIASGFNVRGGSTDQNLVLYDGVPILNTSHAFGFFPAFNADAVGNVSFYRGGIPAEYGGRVSSVLDISGKEATEEWHASGGIGMISAYLAGGGPINEGKTSIMASARMSYSDWMLKTIESAYSELSESSVSFFDASLKLSHRFNDRSKLTFSGYASNDRFSLINDSTYFAANFAGSLRYSLKLSDRVDFSAAIDVGKYSYKLTESFPTTAFELGYDVTYPALKLDLHIEGRHRVSVGLHNTYYIFNPGYLKPTTAESNAATINIAEERGLETAIYISDGFNLNEKLFVDAGLRFSMFNTLGPGTKYLYAENKPLEIQNVRDSVMYGRGEVMNTYTGLEPRLSLRYILSDNGSIKFGYNRIFQYIHLISNTAAIAPVDVWQISNGYFRPQKGDQFSLGYFMSTRNGRYEAFAEGFYKHVDQVLDYKDGSSLILNAHPETSLIPAKAYSYGIEFSVSRITGRLTGTLSYTWSRSFRQTISSFQAEMINRGDPYPSNYDQPHVVQLSWRYNLSRRWFFTGAFVYHTGRPMSVPVSAYMVDHVPVMEFTERNSHRIPDYHRLDVALVLEGNHKRRKLWDGTWTLSLYNVYARKNAYAVFYQDNGKGMLKPYKLSVVGTIVPSLSYSFKI
ncbi:MAG: TonB-dependent receptor plug domain-containing protein [Chryseolinea sp.]